MKLLHGLSAAVTVVLSLVVVAAASADPPPRTPIPLPDPFVLLGGQFCNFDVLVTYTNINEVFTTRTNPDGSTTFRVTGSAFATVKNQTTGKTLSYNISGPGTQTVYPDGTIKFDVAGPNLFWTARANSFPGVPFLSYTTGHLTLTVAPNGTTPQYNLSGRRTDVCAALA